AFGFRDGKSSGAQVDSQSVRLIQGDEGKFGAGGQIDHQPRPVGRNGDPGIDHIGQGRWAGLVLGMHDAQENQGQQWQQRQSSQKLSGQNATGSRSSMASMSPARGDSSATRSFMR